MKSIYRIQDAAGRGPWKPGFSHLWVEPRPDHDNLKPFFQEMPVDLAINIPGHYAGCGCTSLDKLRRWISPSEYFTLLKYGYKAVEIRGAKIVAESETQCVFLSRKPLPKVAREIHLYEVER